MNFTVQDGEMSGPSASFLHDAQQLKPGFALFIYQCISAFNYILLVLKSWIRVLKCWWQCAKGPFWQDHKDHSGTGCWSGNITRLAGWRASDLTYESYPCKEKSKSESSGPPRGACQNGPIFHCHRQLKPRTKLRLKFVRVLSAVQRARSRKALHTSPFSRLVLSGIYAQGGHRFPGFEIPRGEDGATH